MIVDSLNNVFKGLGDFTSKVVNVFDDGFGIYTSIADRVSAIKQIDKDTVQESTQAVTVDQQAEQDLKALYQKNITTASMALIAAGILFVILLVLIARRKRG